MFRQVNSAKFSGIYRICEVYRDGGYIQVVEDCARESMAKAAEEVKALPHYAQDGEVRLFMYICIFQWQVQILSSQWVITDARHDSTTNAYHTTVPCLSGRLELHIRLHHSNDLYSI